MMLSKKRKLIGWISVLLCSVFLSSCVHIVVQEITVKTKFSKKYNCPRKKVHFVENDSDNIGDVYKLVGCGVTAVYNGTQEVYSQK